MQSALIVEVEVGGQAAMGGARRVIISDVHLFIFDRAPESLGEHVVERAAFAIHADLDRTIEQAIEIPRTGEMTPLVAIPDQRRRLSQGAVDRGEDEIELQRLLQFPRDDETREPIENRDEVHPAFCQADIREINPPNVIRRRRDDSPNQAWNDAMAGRWFPEIWFRPNRDDAHLVHVPLNRLAIDQKSVAPELRRDPPRAIARMRRDILIN